MRATHESNVSYITKKITKFRTKLSNTAYPQLNPISLRSHRKKLRYLLLFEIQENFNYIPVHIYSSNGGMQQIDDDLLNSSHYSCTSTNSTMDETGVSSNAASVDDLRQIYLTAYNEELSV